jgi:hypothetical protein
LSVHETGAVNTVGVGVPSVTTRLSAYGADPARTPGPGVTVLGLTRMVAEPLAGRWPEPPSWTVYQVPDDRLTVYEYAWLVSLVSVRDCPPGAALEQSEVGNARLPDVVATGFEFEDPDRFTQGVIQVPGNSAQND